MKIKMIRPVAPTSEHGALLPGNVIELPTKTAEAYIAAGLAIKVRAGEESKGESKGKKKRDGER